MRILVTGAAGNLGRELMKALAADHEVRGIDVADLDITDFKAVRSYIADYAPDLVINSAAWTDVDGCARDPHKAIRINGYGAQNLALAAHAIGAAILQISSNEVFDGTIGRPYREYDARNPINPYAYSKFVGERSVEAVNPLHYIVRISWLIAHGGRNFIHAILDRAGQGAPLRVVVNEVANPTYTPDVVTAIAKLIETRRYGIYHLPNAGIISRYGLARYVLDRAGYTDIPITPISSHEWPRPSRPPQYTGMENMHAAALGITLRDWREAVDAFLEKEGFLHSQPME